MAFGAQLQPVADQLISLFGDDRTVTLRRYTLSGSTASGTKAKTLAETVTAKAVVVSGNVLEIDGWQFGDKTLIISASAFASEPLDSLWTVQEQGGVELSVGKITAVKPGGDVVYYQALIREGAHAR